MMLFGDEGNLIAADDVFPTHAIASDEKAQDILQSCLINGFERAIDLGMPPLAALGQILCWAGAEMARIDPQKSPPPALGRKKRQPSHF
jgi:hypothetical protein